MSLLCSDLLTLSIIDNNLCQNSSIHRSEYCRPNSLSFFKEYYYWRLLPLGALCGRTSRTTLATVPVACRGCWMPGAKEVLGCPQTYFVLLSQNFLRFFLVVHQNFSLFSHQLSNFTRIRSLDATQCCIMPR